MLKRRKFAKKNEDVLLSQILSQDDKMKKTRRKSKRRITEFRINRVKHILNLVYAKNHILSLTEIRKEFLNQYEKDFEFKIDKKTIKNLINQLQKVELLKIKKIRITAENKSKFFHQVQIKCFVLKNNLTINWKELDLQELVGIKQNVSEPGWLKIIIFCNFKKLISKKTKSMKSKSPNSIKISNF